MSRDVKVLLDEIARNGGSIAIDLLSDAQRAAAEKAERDGLLCWQSGGWGATDYYVLTEHHIRLADWIRRVMSLAQ